MRIFGRLARDGAGIEAIADIRRIAPGRDRLMVRLFRLWIIILAFIVVAIVLLMARSPFEWSTDFQIFHQVGELIWRGDLAKAYDLASFSRIEAAATGQPGTQISWAYPPQFDLVVALLGAGPIIPMYVGFVLASFGAFLAALTRLGTERAAWALALAFPAMLINAANGQNGFLSGALVAWFAVAWLRNDAKAGIPLGLMVFKPHLALGLAALALMRGKHRLLGWTVVFAAATGLLATVVFGAGVWSEFIHGARQASGALEAGTFHFYRMTSVYTAARTLGLPFAPAMTLHLVVVALALLALWWTSRAGAAEEAVLGLAILTTLLFSPYVYDYDFAIFGVAVAVMAPLFIQQLRPSGTALLWAAAWFVCGWGIVGIFAANLHDRLFGAGPVHVFPSLPGLIYPVTVFALARGATRHTRHTAGFGVLAKP